MTKIINVGLDIGVAKQIQGYEVDAEQDKNGIWHFLFNGECWIASDYAFKEQTGI